MLPLPENRQLPLPENRQLPLPENRQLPLPENRRNFPQIHAFVSGKILRAQGWPNTWSTACPGSTMPAD